MAPKKAKSTPGKWEFITTSATHRCPNAAERTLMRRHIMRDIGYSRRQCQQTDTSDDDLSSSSSNSGKVLVKSSKSSFPWQFPAKIMTPVPISNESHYALRQMFSDTIPTYLRIYKDMWYPVCSHDPAAFHQMLACFANHLFRLHGGQDRKMHHIMISNHMQALCLVRERIAVAEDQPITEGFLLAILMMACYSHINADLETWRLHMSAVRNIVAMRNIACQDGVRFPHFHRRLEAIGSYSFGIHLSPDAPNPTPMKSPTIDPATLGKALTDTIEAMEYCYQHPLTRAFEALHNIVDYLAKQPLTQSSSIWEDPFKLDMLIDPVTQEFLFFPAEMNGPGPSSATASCLCAGALLFMAELRRRSGIAPVITTYQVEKLRNSLRTDDCVALSSVTQLWLMTVGALESTNPADWRYFCLEIQRLRNELHIESFAQYHNALHQVMWLSELFNERLSSLFLQLEMEADEQHAKGNYHLVHLSTT